MGSKVKEKKEKKQPDIKLSSVFKYLAYSYKYAKKEKFYLFLVLVANVLLTIISVAVPVFNAKQIVALTDGAWTRLIIIIVTIFGLEITRNLGRYIYSISWNRYFYSVKKNIQLDLADEILRITQEDLNSNSSGVFIERLNNDTEKLTDIFVDLLDWISSIVGGIGVFISIFFINKLIFLIYLVFILVLFFLQKKTQEIVMEKRKIHIKNREKVNGFTSEIIRGAKDIKILNAEKSFLLHASKIMDTLKDSGKDLNSTRAKMNFFNGDIRDLLDLIIGLLGVYFIINGQLTVSAMLIIYNYSPRIMNLSSWFERLIECISEFNLSASRIFGILAESEFHKESFGEKHVRKLNGNIAFDKVSFSYEDGQVVLKNMSFTVSQNKTVAFVGKSGAGKSTIFNLISKLYNPEKGNIYLDDYNISDLDRASIRGNLSIISQNPYIYNMSIRENLQVIKQNATKKEIEEACKMACLHDFIMTLKDGYDTVVGEGGVTLSGGQKQRLAIARAFLLKTKIILFDEATSALDNETQKEITKAIENMKGDYTVLIIAHRLSTVQNADEIFVIDKGKVVDSGTKSYLLKNCKVFKKLYETELEDEN